MLTCSTGLSDNVHYQYVVMIWNEKWTKKVHITTKGPMILQGTKHVSIMLQFVSYSIIYTW